VRLLNRRYEKKNSQASRSAVTLFLDFSCASALFHFSNVPVAANSVRADRLPVPTSFTASSTRTHRVNVIRCLHTDTDTHTHAHTRTGPNYVNKSATAVLSLLTTFCVYFSLLNLHYYIHAGWSDLDSVSQATDLKVFSSGDRVSILLINALGPVQFLYLFT